ncbi:probable caffeoyl-CoA O-methyltransferase 2 [Orbicella faveolata]|uniref:probable caffeoyl-CoA O-methyltransferase 2 n=1 Tax=Orbicella faveolata TaxID=48498 RepID=UPI0009E3A02B|nr:probable caffeoyl-CoA O-methyltransferase 2 [Orbicella faveolata]
MRLIISQALTSLNLNRVIHLREMSFLSENKLFFGAVGIAVSSAVAGFVAARVLGRKSDEDYKETKMHMEINSPVTKYLMEYGLREPSPLRKLREATMNHKLNHILCSADEAQLMRLLLQLIKAKKTIEIGVYTGYNTLSMAMALPPDGKVVACDITDEYMNDVQSQRFFKEAGVESKIDLRLQSATATLDELLSAGEAESYDMVFIDADKKSYDDYYEKSLQLVRKGGLIVVDNVSDETSCWLSPTELELLNYFACQANSFRYDIAAEVQNVQFVSFFSPQAGVESKIDLRLQSATATLDELLSAGEAESYDMVFIDADKKSYDDYYEKSLQLVRKGGLIVVDNVLWGSKVCDPEKRVSDEETRFLHTLNVKIHGDSRVAISFLPFADGVTLAMKL